MLNLAYLWLGGRAVRGRRTLGRELGIGDLAVDAPETLAKQDFDLVVVSNGVDRGVAVDRLTGMGFSHGKGFIFADEPVAFDGLEVCLSVPITLRQGLRVVLFGTGEGGMVARGLAIERSWNIVCCVDSDASRWGRRFGDREIRVLRRCATATSISFWCAPPPGRRAIAEQLTGMGFEHRVHYLDFRDADQSRR